MEQKQTSPSGLPSEMEKSRKVISRISGAESMGQCALKKH